MDRSLGNKPLGPFSGGELTDPADESLVATTGALNAGNYEVIVTVGASAAADVRLERRNAADDAAVGNTVVLKLAAGQSAQYRFSFHLEASERVSIYMDNALTGTLSAALNAELWA